MAWKAATPIQPAKATGVYCLKRTPATAAFNVVLLAGRNTFSLRRLNYSCSVSRNPLERILPLIVDQL